jgi:uroporphyrinogen decarboxylase
MYIANHPLAGASITDIAKYSFPACTNQNLFTNIREEALAKSQNKLFALSTGIGGSLIETCSNLRGVENWFIDTMESPLLCETLLDKVLKYWIGVYTDLLKEIGDIVDIVIIGDDLAGQNGPLFSLDFYRSMLKPRQKELIKHIKSLTAAIICYHTCGSCFDFIPDLIDIGIDILNPIQIGLKNMDPQKIKNEFGKYISLWGGAINNNQPLSFSSPEEITHEVKKNIEIFKQRSGYIFSNTHNIQFDVPPENIVTLFDAAFEFSTYK